MYFVLESHPSQRLTYLKLTFQFGILICVSVPTKPTIFLAVFRSASVQRTNHLGETALHHGVRHGCLDALRLLLQAGGLPTPVSPVIQSTYKPFHLLLFPNEIRILIFLIAFPALHIRCFCSLIKPIRLP